MRPGPALPGRLTRLPARSARGRHGGAGQGRHALDRRHAGKLRGDPEDEGQAPPGSDALI